jgi:hypothetical protein
MTTTSLSPSDARNHWWAPQVSASFLIAVIFPLTVDFSPAAISGPKCKVQVALLSVRHGPQLSSHSATLFYYTFCSAGLLINLPLIRHTSLERYGNSLFATSAPNTVRDSSLYRRGGWDPVCWRTRLMNIHGLVNRGAWRKDSESLKLFETFKQCWNPDLPLLSICLQTSTFNTRGEAVRLVNVEKGGTISVAPAATFFATVNLSVAVRSWTQPDFQVWACQGSNLNQVKRSSNMASVPVRSICRSLIQHYLHSRAHDL